MEGIQTLLIIVVIALTTLLLVVGAQVLMMVMDLRRALKRLNSILDDSILGGGLLRPDKLTSVIELLRKRGMKRHGDGS